MKTAILAFAAAAVLAPAGAARAGDVEITFEGVSPLTGALRVGLFTEDNYRDGGGVAGATVAADSERVTTVLADVPPGVYALKVYHDVDCDGALDANMFGIPTEPVAFSNNAPMRFGPASWEDARFEVGPDGAAQRIQF